MELVHLINKGHLFLDLRIAHSNNLKRKKGPCMLIIDENFPAPKLHPKLFLATKLVAEH
jgi:hypothetical protein